MQPKRRIQNPIAARDPPAKTVATPARSNCLPIVAGPTIRIISDIHYGDRASQVRTIAQLQPLFADVDRVVLNGDTLDTRLGPRPAYTTECRREWEEFAIRGPAPVTFLTGNHDPDISELHSIDLAEGAVFVAHGDILFDDIVPWGRDARTIRRRIVERLGPTVWPQRVQGDLDEQFGLWRQVAGSIPQRHQSERHPLKYLLRFAIDTVWPPTRILKIVGAWQAEPGRAAELLRRHRPKAKFAVVGHTHRPSVRRTANGSVVINTGSFTAPFGGYFVDVTADRLCVRRIRRRARDFVPGATVAEFPLVHS